MYLHPKPHLSARLEQRVAPELCEQPVLEVLRLGDVDGGLGVAVEGERVGAVTQEEGAHLAPPLRGRLVQRRELPQVHRVHVRAVPDQQLSHLGRVGKNESVDSDFMCRL